MNNKNLENEFDINFYITMNNDLAVRFGYNFSKIKQHFFSIGFKENRLYSKSHSNLFYYHDWIKYMNKNKDILSKQINNDILAFKHYLYHGMKEKREIYKKEYLKYESVTIPCESNLEIIDIAFFKKVNTQFSGLNDSEIIKFICENKNECLYTINHRYLYENYDWNQYLIDYPDLKINKIFSKIDALLHYTLFGSKEGRNIKSLKNKSETNKNFDSNTENENQEENQEENIVNNNCINILDKIENPELYDENLIELFKNNILENSNNLDIDKYDIKDITEMNKMYEILSLDFDYIYYYKLNNKKYKLENNEESCIIHFLHDGLNNYLPYSKNHYLLYINYNWNEYAEKYSLTKNDDFNSFCHYIQNNYYFNNKTNLPSIKYSINDFINEFYNKIYYNKTKFLISYRNFLQIEDENKIYPNLFNYFLYQVINWESFKSENNLKNTTIELMNILIKSDFDLKKYKIDFNTITTLNIPDKQKLLDLSQFKHFYNKIINYIKHNKNIYNIIAINNEFNKLFNKDLFDIPSKFIFKNYNPYVNKKNKNLSFNIIISYIHKYEPLYNMLLSILYQNFNNYKIIILNKCNDSELENKINDLKKAQNILNEIVIINNNNINDTNLKNNINIFDINLLIDTNYYFSNNNIFEFLNELYEKNNYCFEKVLIEKKTHNNKQINSLLIINSNILLNNLFLLHNYFEYEFDINYITNINNLLLINNKHFIDHKFYNSDIKINDLIIFTYPIFIIYENKENVKYIKDINYYILFHSSNNKEFNNFIKYLNDNNIYDYINIIFIDKVVNNFDLININPIKVDSYNIINIYTKSKRRSVKKNYKNLPKINTYEALVCNYFTRNNYLKNDSKS